MLLPTRSRGSLRAALFAALALSAFAASGAGAATSASAPASMETERGWIEGMETAPKGPFTRIRWFCSDGSVLPPKAYACKDHGGGIQHGEWSSETKQLRARGFLVGNVLAGLNPESFTGSDPDLSQLKQILLERFLVGWDDGWIFRGARSYRGALQSEDEEAGARKVVMAMLADPAWRAPERYLLLRETVRLFPLQADRETASSVRLQALDLAKKDASFNPLRAKIHNAPDAADAAAVRSYAAKKGNGALGGEFARLADSIDRLYQSAGGIAALDALSTTVGNGDLRATLDTGTKRLRAATTPEETIASASAMMALLRESFPALEPPAVALEALETSLTLENDVYATGNELMTQLPGLTRRQRVDLLGVSAEALYGAGFLSRRQQTAVNDSIERLTKTPDPSLDTYRSEVRYLARVTEWSDRALAFNFGETVQQWAQIESEAHLYTQDRMRGSPLLVYGALIDSLALDGNRLAGIRHELFGQSVGTGLRALNPGLARGALRLATGATAKNVDSGGIYVLPETTADLPPVSGIITRGEGNSLSHVQLLARNLGIPNVVVGDEHIAVVKQHAGEEVVLAVTPGGIVQLNRDGPEWEAAFGAEHEASGGTEGLVIRPDLEKLDLSVHRLVTLSSLRASDSGRLSGPKGANLGELKHSFGDAVPAGFVIPFGIFRQLLDQPLAPGGPSVWNWMKERYTAIAAESDAAKKKAMAAAFLSNLRNWILEADPGPDFRTALEKQLQASFGAPGTYGVFVRSDTNVEDLPGFTGAGLNLTVANVVGTANILKAIHDVWASPFDERAYGWRQSHMQNPEYVFPAVVIQLAFASDKSGVMVTTDIEDQQPGWVTVAISEGVGGAVEGQAAESVRIDTVNRRLRLLAQATAPRKTVLNPKGGVLHVAASGSDRVLTGNEAMQLIQLAKKVRDLDSLRDENGVVRPADMEFGFKDGKLALLQIRPFVESESALTNPILAKLDSETKRGKDVRVPLGAVPPSE